MSTVPVSLPQVLAKKPPRISNRLRSYKSFWASTGTGAGGFCVRSAAMPAWLNIASEIAAIPAVWNDRRIRPPKKQMCGQDSANCGKLVPSGHPQSQRGRAKQVANRHETYAVFQRATHSRHTVSD